MLGGLLQLATTHAKARAARIFLYALEKWGKTSFAAFAPNPFFAMTRGEDGLVTLMNAGRLPPTMHFPEELRNWSRLRQVTEALLQEEHDRKSFVVDTANGKDKKVKAGSSARMLFTGESAAHLAGNRYGLPREIPCGSSAADAWKAFVAEMRKAKPPAPAKPVEKTTEKPAEPKPDEKKPEAKPEPPMSEVECDDDGNPIFPPETTGRALFDNEAPGRMPD